MNVTGRLWKTTKVYKLLSKTVYYILVTCIKIEVKTIYVTAAESVSFLSSLVLFPTLVRRCRRCILLFPVYLNSTLAGGVWRAYLGYHSGKDDYEVC